MAYSDVVLALTPGGYWRFTEASGSLLDSSGNSNTGTATGAPTYSQPGLIVTDATSKSLKFAAASSQRVAVPSAATVNPADTFTLMAWIQRTSASQNVSMGVIGKGNGAGHLSLANDGTFQLLKSQVAVLSTSTSTIPLADTTNPYFIAATKSGSTVHLYLNGSDVTGAVTNSTCATNTQHFYIGCDGGGGDSPVTFANLFISEGAVWATTALSAANIANIYAAGVPASTGQTNRMLMGVG